MGNQYQLFLNCFVWVTVLKDQGRYNVLPVRAVACLSGQYKMAQQNWQNLDKNVFQFIHYTPHLGLNLGLHSEKALYNHLSCGTALAQLYEISI